LFQPVASACGQATTAQQHHGGTSNAHHFGFCPTLTVTGMWVTGCFEELARQAGVSRFHFARQFRLSTGKSPMEYLRQVRIERSKSILQTRDTSIAEIAARLGFSDQSHFTRIFGRLVGVPPGSYARCDNLAIEHDGRERA
jgi:AraC-like DNA-binding protein